MLKEVITAAMKEFEEKEKAKQATLEEAAKSFFETDISKWIRNAVLDGQTEIQFTVTEKDVSNYIHQALRPNIACPAWQAMLKTLADIINDELCDNKEKDDTGCTISVDAKNVEVAIKW